MARAEEAPYDDNRTNERRRTERNGKERRTRTVSLSLVAGAEQVTPSLSALIAVHTSTSEPSFFCAVGAEPKQTPKPRRDFASLLCLLGFPVFDHPLSDLSSPQRGASFGRARFMAECSSVSPVRACAFVSWRCHKSLLRPVPHLSVTSVAFGISWPKRSRLRFRDSFLSSPGT